MKISYNWLREFIPAIPSPHEVSVILTDIGLEVESLEQAEPISGGLKGLVIGKVLSREQHPNADRLSLTKVDTGQQEPLQIVCGAANVAAGQKVLVAPVGTRVHPVKGEPFLINKAKIRGEWSEGMICAEDEVGLGTSHEGIMVLDENAPVGTSAREYFQIEEDYIFEIGLTPNRADAASHLGVARDLAAARSLQVTFPKIETNIREPEVTGPVAIQIEDAEACPRYSALLIEGIQVQESPDWLKNRLRLIGLKPVNNIVDITNYVMMELGQPLHAFDARVVGNKVSIKKLPEGTAFTTLDGTTRKLSSEDLMICNAQEGMCIAGVFGGAGSGVTAGTTSVFLESAYFNPVSIRKTSKRHGLKTDAAFRFERGTDPEMTLNALKRAAFLIKKIAGGNITAPLMDIYPRPVKQAEVTVNYANLNRLVGQEIPASTIKSILQGLGITILAESQEQLQLVIPAYKVDVTREVDIVEEILRIYGYNRIAVPETLHASLSFTEKKGREKIQHLLSEMLVANGFYEIMSNSLSSSAYYPEQDDVITILNPLSAELNVLRKSLLFSGLEAIAYNRNRKQEDMLLFEFGKSYALQNGYRETNLLGLFMTGRVHSEQWNTSSEQNQFFHLKGVLDALLGRLNIRFTSAPCRDKIFNSGLEYFISEGISLVKFGQLEAKLLKAQDIDAPVYFAELSVDVLVSGLNKQIQVEDIPKFPAVRRDLSMLLDRDISFEKLKDLAFEAEKNILTGVSIFDVYQGEHVPEGKKSYALSFILQDKEATLTDKRIDQVMERIMLAYERQAGASIRK